MAECLHCGSQSWLMVWPLARVDSPSQRNHFGEDDESSRAKIRRNKR
jgi:hypothetical protein